MGGFPQDESKGLRGNFLGSGCRGIVRATKVIVKSIHEALGIPTKKRMRRLKATKQMVAMLKVRFCR